MDFSFSSDQQLLKNSARGFLDEHVKPATVRLLWDDPRGESDTLWKEIAQLGWLGLSLPEAHGGRGLGMVEPAPVMDLATRLVDVTLDRAPVAADALLGGPGQAGPLLAALLRRGAVGAAAEMLGAARRCLDMAVGYAKVREQFGQPIGSFQAIRHKCAEMLLADMGADVVKVESLEGDSFRELPGFFGWNRGKRSIALNLKTPEGRAIVETLATRGDVVMENMRPGVADRLGVGHRHLSSLNPRLVYCSVTAFGSTGPGTERPGFDPIFQALGGLMTLQGFGGPPQYLRTAPTDYYTAAVATQGILAALFARERTGRGQRLETSLLRGVLALQAGVAE